MSYSVQNFREVINEDSFGLSSNITACRDELEDIFCHSNRREIKILLDSFFSLNPKFCLYVYDFFRLDLIYHDYGDAGFDFTNDSIEKSDFTEEQKLKIYDLAFKQGFPHIYRLAEKIDTFTLNFLWVNLNPQNRAKNKAEHVFGEGVGNLYHLSQHKALARWARVNKKTNIKINLWCDTALLTENAVLKTLAQLKFLSKKRAVQFKLRDIRVILDKEENRDLKKFFHPSVPVYFRVDFLKVLITDYMMGYEEENYCVVSDIDVEPMNYRQIFDKCTVDFLENKGYVLLRMVNSSCTRYFENSFFIFNKKHSNIRDDHRCIITEIRNMDANEEVMDSESVFLKYKKFIYDKKGECNNLDYPRKVAVSPISKFADPNFNEKDIEVEEFLFKKGSVVPLVSYGRNYMVEIEDEPCRPIVTLEKWEVRSIPIDES